MSRTFEEQHLFEIEIVICNIIHLILLSHYTVYFQVMVKRHRIDFKIDVKKQVKYANQTDVKKFM